MLIGLSWIIDSIPHHHVFADNLWWKSDLPSSGKVPNFWILWPDNKVCSSKFSWAAFVPQLLVMSSELTFACRKRRSRRVGRKDHYYSVVIVDQHSWWLTKMRHSTVVKFLSTIFIKSNYYLCKCPWPRCLFVHYLLPDRLRYGNTNGTMLSQIVRGMF